MSNVTYLGDKFLQSIMQSKSVAKIDEFQNCQYEFNFPFTSFSRQTWFVTKTGNV